MSSISGQRGSFDPIYAASKSTIKGEHPSVSDSVIDVTGIGVVVTDIAALELQVFIPETVNSMTAVPELYVGQ